MSMFPPDQTKAIHVYTDASGRYGGAAVIPFTNWFQCMWPQSWATTGIAVKELVPVVIAAALWGAGWTGRHVIIHSDNIAVVHVLKSRTSQQPVMVHLLRCLSFYAAYYRFEYSPLHVPGRLNTAADALSCNNMTLFSLLIHRYR